jgi:hypothetical protein
MIIPLTSQFDINFKDNQQQETGTIEQNAAAAVQDDAELASQVYQHDPRMMIPLISPFEIKWQAATQEKPSDTTVYKHESQVPGDGGFHDDKEEGTGKEDDKLESDVSSKCKAQKRRKSKSQDTEKGLSLKASERLYFGEPGQLYHDVMHLRVLEHKPTCC